MTTLQSFINSILKICNSLGMGEYLMAWDEKDDNGPEAIGNMEWY